MDIEALRVVLGADLSQLEAGLLVAAKRVEGFASSANTSAQQAKGSLESIGTSATTSAGRYTDAAGRLREANGRFVSSATLAAEAARNVGGATANASNGFAGLGAAAAGASQSINSKLIDAFKRADDASSDLEKGVGRLGETLTSAGKTLSVGVTLPIVGVGLASLKMAGDLEKAQVAFETMLGSAAAATATLTDLKQFAADTPFEFPEVQDAAKKLLAFNTPASELKSTLRAIGDISSGIGAPIGEIADLYGKARVQGRLFQEDINQLTGRGIPIIQELAKQFGVTEGEVRNLVEKGKVNFQNLETAFADLTKEGGKFGGLMQKQSQTIPGLFSTLSDTAGQALARLGAIIADTFNLKEVIPQIASFIQGAVEAFDSLSPAVKQAAVVLAAVTAAAGPLLVVIGSVLAVLPAIEAGLATLGVTSLAALGPIAGIALAVGAAAALIISNWSTIVSYFKSGPGANLFGEVIAAAREGLAVVRVIITDFLAFWNAIWTRFGPVITEELSVAFRVLTSIVSAGLNVVRDLFSVFSQAIQGNWSNLWIALQNLGASALNGLVNILGAAVAGVLGIFSKFAQATGLSTISKALQTASDYVTDFAKRLQIARQPLDDATEGTKNLTEAQKDLAKAIVDTPPVTPSAPALTPEQKKALDDLRQALRDNANLSIALGSSYDYVGGKAKVLQAGIESLVKVGFAPAGAVVRGYVAELNGLATAVDKIAPRLKGLALPKTEDLSKVPALDVPTLDPIPVSLAVLPSIDTTGIQAFDQELLDSVTPALVRAQLAGEQFTESLNTTLVAGIADIATGFGEGIGQILAGAGGLNDLAGIVLGALGGLAIQVGQLAIATGIAVSGIKASLESLNPVLAIAGGIALVALGTAVKGAANKIAGGGGRGAATGASAPTAPRQQTARPATREQIDPQQNTREVVFKIDGKDLVAVTNLAGVRQARTSARTP